MSKKYEEPLETSSEVTDRLIREGERKFLTSISRSQAWILEQKGLFPARLKLGNRSVAWKLSEILAWIESREEA